jgi:hypothetical protein
MRVTSASIMVLSGSIAIFSPLRSGYLLDTLYETDRTCHYISIVHCPQLHQGGIILFREKPTVRSEMASVNPNILTMEGVQLL